MTAISRKLTKIWIVDVDTAASDLVTTSAYSTSNTSGYIAGEIKNYSKTGGETDVESDPVFGGFVDKEKPTSQFEVSFDVVPSLENGNLWESLAYGTDVATGVYSSAGTPTDKAVFIEASDSTNPVGYGFNNCNVTVLDMEHSADDNQTKTLNLKFSPTDGAGIANFISDSQTHNTSFNSITDLPAWTALDNN